MESPKAGGDVIRGTGGLRKLRWLAQGHGKTRRCPAGFITFRMPRGFT